MAWPPEEAPSLRAAAGEGVRQSDMGSQPWRAHPGAQAGGAGHVTAGRKGAATLGWGEDGAPGKRVNTEAQRGRGPGECGPGSASSPGPLQSR